MKKLLFMASACLMLTSHTLLAQTVIGGGARTSSAQKGEPRTYKTKLGNSKGNQVIITMHNSSVQIVGHNSDEVVIESNSNTAPPERAAGLKPMYNQAEDNTGVGIEVTKENNVLRINKASRHEGKYTIRVPRNASVVYHETNWTGGAVNMSDLDGEIELKLNNASATLSNITGPVVANTTSSDMVIKFSSLNQSKPSAISSVAGTVDIHLPANTKANFKLKSIQGEIYSDFDMVVPKDTKSDLQRMTGQNLIDGRTNGGGVEMSLYTISGDMFIRKSK